ncbi:MAG: uroporphyrinogen decarboxylase family protein [Solidesulfovibrio sp.]
MSEPACGHLDAAGVDDELLARLQLAFPETHQDGASMARLALGVKEKKSAALCALPFCCTVEAEALGASIRLGGATSCPRAGAFVCSSLRDVLRLRSMDFILGRISQVLEACSMLTQAGEPVALEVSGPMTILNWLMELAVVLKEWHKEAALMREVLARLGEELHRYALAAAERGIAILCYADPTGTVSILGPKRFAFVADLAVLPLLRRLEADAGFKAAVHVCPKTAYALVDGDRATWRDLPLDHPMPYDEGCLVAGKSALPLGEACIKNNGYYLKKSTIKGLVLS